MKIRWVTYWFRLQNTTLFFYTKKNGSASHLRGYYYIYAVQSVREVQRGDSNRFMFEITMTNGKRKMLAAETAALRKDWVGHLWQAMHLSTSGVSDSTNTHLGVYDQRERLNSSMPICSHSDSVRELLPARPLSAPAPTGHIHHDTKSAASHVCLSEELSSEEAGYQNTLPASNDQHHNGVISPQWSSGMGNAEARQEGDYDVLPLRKKICDVSASTAMDEGVYDFPLSYRRADEHPNHTESIYDVPSSLLRMVSDHTSEEQREDEIYMRL
ncbi:uncharacterized protein [Pempheris klunzingeri]|uniref:uncharacterized protein n=1 Tax=Pempheris klunzingeri TaxID=3127111 RepID=UPI00397F47C9